MDRIGWLLLTWAIGSAVFLVALEAATVLTHTPTISARVRSLGGKTSIVVIWACLAIGYLLAHFWDGFIPS